VNNLNKSLDSIISESTTFIVSLEGINCAGKGTQKVIVSEKLRSIGYEVFLVPQAKDAELFSRIQKRGRGTYLLSEPYSDTIDWTEYYKSQYTDYEDEIKTSDIAIFDRYKPCFEVYQNYFLSEYGVMDIESAQKWTKSCLSGTPDADLTFYLDIPINEMIKRYTKRNDGRQPLTTEDIYYTKGIRKMYKEYPGMNIINGVQNKDIISNKIINSIIGGMMK
jgi:thymidylate kinase